MRKGFLYQVAVVAGLFLFAGCASTEPVPTSAMSNAESAIKIARDSNAIVNAPLELRLAEDKLKAAKAALSAEDHDKARRMSEQALMDAKLAEAKSQSEKAKRGAREMQESIESLRQELNRSLK